MQSPKGTDSTVYRPDPSRQAEREQGKRGHHGKTFDSWLLGMPFTLLVDPLVFRRSLIKTARGESIGLGACPSHP